MKTPKRGTYGWCAVFTLLFAHSVFSASVGVNPTADAFVTTGATGNLVSSNYGAAGAIEVSAPGSAQGEFQSVLQFGLAGPKSSFDSQFGAGQWSVQSVTLQLTLAGPGNPILNASSPGSYSVSWMQNDGWTEGTGTPAAPTSNGITFGTLSNFVSVADDSLGTFSFGGGTNGTMSASLTLSPSFAADILGGGALSLRLFAADSSVSWIANSRNFGTVSARPLLTITATPEPSLAAFFAMSAFLARWMTRYRRY